MSCYQSVSLANLKSPFCLCQLSLVELTHFSPKLISLKPRTLESSLNSPLSSPLSVIVRCPQIFSLETYAFLPFHVHCHHLLLLSGQCNGPLGTEFQLPVSNHCIVPVRCCCWINLLKMVFLSHNSTVQILSSLPVTSRVNASPL